MKFFDKFFSKEIQQVPKEVVYMFTPKGKYNEYLKEQMKGEITQVLKKFPTELGEGVEEHPLNFEVLEKWYKDDTFVNGFIDKLVDSIVSGGFYAKSVDKRAEKVITDFMRDHHFNPLLRTWIRDAIITGNGYLELSGKKSEVPEKLKVLNSKSMFVRRDKQGKILGYVQWRGPKFDSKGKAGISFEPYEIAHYAHKRVGDCAYGLGGIFPLTYILKKKSKLMADMCLLMERKANAPIVAKMGRIVPNEPEKDVIPSKLDMTAFSKKMEWMTNKHEWTVNPYVDMKTLDFGPLGDKFTAPLELINNELFYGSQTPAVLMGQAKIPEGLAEVQKELFALRIVSIQEEIEKEIEGKIFKRVLVANKLEAHVEFEWGQPSSRDKNEEIKTITELLKLYKDMAISEPMREELEKRLVELMGLDELKEIPEEQKKKELEEPQPRVPGQNNPKLMVIPDITEKYTRDFTIREWVNFNYQDYLNDIESYIKAPEYDMYLTETLRGASTEQIDMGMLSKRQTDRMKEVMVDDFRRNKSINQIAKDLRDKVKVKGLSIPQQVDKKGNVIRRAYNLNAESRSINIARTEITKVSNEGALLNFQGKGVERYRWVSSIGTRTCPDCVDMDGKTFTIGTGPSPPLHAACRCTLIPMITEFEKVK